MQIEPAAWAAIPRRIIVLAATAVTDAFAPLQAEGGAHDINSSRGPADTSVRSRGDSSGRDRSACRGDIEGYSGRGTPAAALVGQEHRRVHGTAPRSAYFTANFAPFGAYRRKANSDHDDLDRHWLMRRAVLSVRAVVLANRGGAALPAPFDRRWMRRRAGEAEISGIEVRGRP